VKLAGVDIQEQDGLELAIVLRQNGYAEAASRIETTAEEHKNEVALTIKDREDILSVLVETDSELAKLPAVLLEEHVARKQTGL
jgi:hypothetical protein